MHSYTQETHILIYILKYLSAFILLGMRLSKYQQIHPDIYTCCAANVYIVVYICIEAPMVPFNSDKINVLGKRWCMNENV